MAMEDFRVDVVIGKGPGATAIPLEIPPFTLVGATTRAGLLPGPAARPVRLHRPPGVLRARTSSTGSCTAPPGCSASSSPTTGPPRSPPAPAARRGSPTGCCAGSATSPRSAPTAWSPSTVAQRGPRALRGRRARPRPARPGRARRAVPAVRRGTGRRLHARGRRRARSARPSRRSPSRSWSATASWPVRRAAGSPRRPPGSTSGCGRRRAPRRRSGRHAVRGLRFESPGFVAYDPAVTLHRRSARRWAAPSHASAREVRFVPELVSLLPLVGIALLFWLLIIRPASPGGRRNSRRMQASLTVGDEVDADVGHLRHGQRDRGRPRPGRDRRRA